MALRVSYARWFASAVAVVCGTLSVANTSCLLVVDPEGYLVAGSGDPSSGGSGAEGPGPSSGGGGSAQGAGGQGGGASGGGGSAQGAGGTGGEGGQPCADTKTSPENCGACGWDCAGGTCKEGVCQPFAVDLVDSKYVAVHGDDVYVVVGEGCATQANIQVFDTLFGSATSTATIPTLDPCGLRWARGPDRVYYAPQNSAAVVEACVDGACERVTFGPLNGSHVNHAAVAGDQFYMTVPFDTLTEIRAALIAPDGVPGQVSTVVATTNDEGEGGQFMVYDEATQRLWWTTASDGGCLYREATADLDGGDKACFALNPADPLFPSVVAIEKAPQGGVYAFTKGASTQRKLFHVDDAGVVTPVPNPGAGQFPPIGPLRADDTSLYVGYAQGGFNVVDPLTNEVRAGIAFDYEVTDMDVSHPDYVFFTGNGELHRWRKLPPAN